MNTLFTPPRSGRGDYHAHIFRANEFAVENPLYVPDYDATVEQYIAALRNHGLSWGTLVQPSFLGFDNTVVLNALEEHEDLFRGVVCVNPESPLSSVGDLKRWHELGVRGIRINQYTPPIPDLAHPDWWKLTKLLADMGWFLQFFVGPADIARLSGTFRQLPCMVVIDHLGLPASTDVEEHPIMPLLELPDLWVKASGAYRCGPGAARTMVDEMQGRGFDRLVPGSDWPHTQFDGEPEDSWLFFDYLDRDKGASTT